MLTTLNNGIVVSFSMVFFDRFCTNHYLQSAYAANRVLRQEHAESIAQYLEQLLNTRRQSVTAESSSLLYNYGLTDLSQFNPRSASDCQALEQQLQQLITTYEPRFIKVQVEISNAKDDLNMSLQIVIKAMTRFDDEDLVFNAEFNPINNRVAFT